MPADELPSANSLTSLSLNLGRVVGPAAAFALNGLSFVISSALLAPLLAVKLAHPTGGGEPIQPWRDLRQGFATVMAVPWLWVSILVFALANITLAGPYAVAMPFLVKNTMNANLGTLGLLYTMFPIGYIVGGVWLGRYARIRRRGPLMYGATALASLLLGAFGLLPPLWVLVIAALVNGAALEAGPLIWTNSLQSMVPNEQLGRVVSIDSLGSYSLLPIGLALAGWATERVGPRAVFVIGGLFTAAVTLAALAHPAIRGLD